MADKKFDLGSYIEVHERVGAFYDRYPEGRIVSSTPRVITVADNIFVEVHTAAFRDQTGEMPTGEATAWEPFPGKTPYTKDSEMMNAETSAIGRALAAAGIETKRSMASADEIRNRRDERSWQERITQACASEGIRVDDLCMAASRNARKSLELFEEIDVPTLRAAFKRLVDERGKDAAEGTITSPPAPGEPAHRSSGANSGEAS
jgi:hypothetical protein